MSSVTVTFVPRGTFGPITQKPPGAGPAGTLTTPTPFASAAVKVNGVPTATPGPATLQILKRLGWHIGPVAAPRSTPALVIIITTLGTPTGEPTRVAWFDTGPQAVTVAR